LKVNFESNGKIDYKVHLTLSISKNTLDKFKYFFPEINISRSLENSMINEIEKDRRI